MRHAPVCLEPTIDSLMLNSGDNAIDCTLGDGGHAEAILERTGPKGRLLGIDADVEAILSAKRFLYRYGDRVIYERDNFKNLKKIVEKLGFAPVKAVLMDLGWSSTQFMERGRGFSFDPPAGGDEPLDMRYDVSRKVKGESLKSDDVVTAKDIVNNYSEKDLAGIFRKYGEEKYSREIARALVEKRKIKPIATSKELAETVLEVYRKILKSDKEVPWVGGHHPATLVFQALRIAVNDELNILKIALPQAVEVLEAGGRLAVISFHSLEDRVVKQYFKSIENKLIKLVNKKPIMASEEELRQNPRARSAKLRVVEKLGAL